jgi:hypothetical protein
MTNDETIKMKEAQNPKLEYAQGSRFGHLIICALKFFRHADLGISHYSLAVRQQSHTVH